MSPVGSPGWLPSEPAMRRNFFWAALNGALFEFGAALADTGTVIAGFLMRLGGGPTAVGAAAAIARFGWFFPQLVVASYARRRPYRKPIYLAGGWGRALALGVLAVALLATSRLGQEGARPALLVLFFTLWILFSFVAGLAGVPYNDVIARAIRSEWRSRLLATRLFVGATLAAAGALGIRTLLRESPPTSLAPYAVIFGAGAIALALSTASFAMIVEPPARPSLGRANFTGFLREGLGVVRDDRRFRLFLYVQLASGVTKMAAPFYLLQARVASGVPEFEIGMLLAAQMVGGVALNPLWGWWGDRRGKLSLLRLLAGLTAVSPLLAILLPLLELSPAVTRLGYGAVFFFIGAALSGETVADLGYLMEISPDERRPEYSGYMNTLVAPSRLLPLVGGAIVAVVSFEALFALSAVAVGVRLGLLSRLGQMSPAGLRVHP